MDITNYIETELYIIVPVLYALGAILKKSSAIDDRWIPIILGGMGIVLATVYKFGIYIPQGGEILSVLYAGVTQGILCAAASVYTNNLIKQLKKKDEDDNKSDNDAG